MLSPIGRNTYRAFFCPLAYCSNERQFPKRKSKPSTAIPPIRETAMQRPLLLFYQVTGLCAHIYKHQNYETKDFRV